MATGSVCPSDDTARPVHLPTTLRDTRDDPVPILMRCWRDVGDRMAHVPPETNWTDWRQCADWTLPLPDIRTVSTIALGIYEFTERTIKMYAHSLLSMPHVGAAIHVAAERRFIGWREAHAAVGGSFEVYMQALNAGAISNGERTLYEDLFAADAYTPAALSELVEGAQRAVSSAPSLEVEPGISVLSLMARPTRWESHVWDLYRVRPLNKILVGTMPDIVSYNWCDSVPVEDMPFVISTMIESGTRPLEELGGKAAYPPTGFNGPQLMMANYQAELGLNDLADPTTADIWLNRLVHFAPAYFLAEFDSGQAAASAPAPGQAPVPLIRRPDSWRQIVGMDQHDIQQQYPCVSTTWMPWTDCLRHKVVALLFQDHSTFWQQLVRFGYGGLSAGITWDGSCPRLAWYKPLADKGPGLRSLLDRYSGNGKGGGARELGAESSPTTSSEQPPSTDPPQDNTN